MEGRGNRSGEEGNGMDRNGKGPTGKGIRMILKCKCEHKDQDKFHGKHMRVHNPLAKEKSSTTQKWRCTVCGDVKEGKENG